MRLTVPLKFYDDHCSRDLPGGTEIRRSARQVVVEMTEEEARELLDDAKFYSDQWGPDGGPGLKASAKATVKALRRHHL